MMDTKKVKQIFTEWVDSDEGEAYFQKRALAREQYELSLDRFHAKYSSKEKFANFVENVLNKYDNEKYREYWYNQSIEPPEELCWHLFSYAQKYGRECTKREWEKYGNDFTSALYYVNGYYFNRMDGQGSVIKVTHE